MAANWELGYPRPRGGMAYLLTIVAERANCKYRICKPNETDEA